MINSQVAILTMLFIGTIGMVIYAVSDMLREMRKEKNHE